MTEQRTLGPRTLLACFAHPDDETYTVGGTLAHYANQDTRVVLISATLGEAGETGGLTTRKELPKVREEELRCAARRLGVNHLVLLGYHDSGMQGSPENDSPRALINADRQEVIRQLVGVIRHMRPLVVITFEPNGGYGHPDHKLISELTVAAFHAAADPERYLEQGPPWQPARLFFTSLTPSFFRKLKQLLEVHGLDSSQAEQYIDQSWPDEQVNTLLDVSQDVEAKWAAFQCYRTQMQTMKLFYSLPEEEMKQLLNREYFQLIWPEPKSGQRLNDLFEGL